MAARRPFLTEYFEGGYRYGAEVWARSRKEATFFCQLRGLGEKVLGSGVRLTAPRVSSVLRSRRPFHDKLHALCWLAFLAISADRAHPRDFFGDVGILHEWAHYLTPAIREESSMRLRPLLRRVEEIEARIPGYPPKKRLTRPR